MKSVKVYKLCECDSVAAETVEQAIEWYLRDTGLTRNDIYPAERIRTVPMEKEVMDDGDGQLVSVREIVNRYWQGKPFVAISTEW